MRLLKIVLALILVVGAAIGSYSEDKFPSPSGYANDFAGVLSSSQLRQLESISSTLQKRNGAELAVVVVKSTSPNDSKGYAVKLFNKWGIGQKGKDNGVLLLLAMDERKVEIEVGYGMEALLPDAKCGRILDTYAVPNFKKGRMGTGLVATAQALAKVMAGEKVALKPAVKKQDKTDDATVTYVIMMLIVGLPFILIFSLSLARPWMILTVGIGILVGWFLFGWQGSAICGLAGLVIGWFTPKVDFSGWSGNGSNSSTPSSYSSPSSPSSPSNDNSDSFGGFSGGSSGGGGAGRSW